MTNPEQINHQKILIRTLLAVLAMVVIVVLLNSWPNIKESFNGNTPSLDVWISHSFQKRHFLTVAIMAAYFYYRNVQREKQLIEKRKNWTSAE